MATACNHLPPPPPPHLAYCSTRTQLEGDLMGAYHTYYFSGSLTLMSRCDSRVLRVVIMVRTEFRVRGGVIAEWQRGGRFGA